MKGFGGPGCETLWKTVIVGWDKLKVFNAINENPPV
jgi:hypothetical protein